MRWFRRLLLTAVIGALACLAIWPHLPALQKEAQHIYDTWQSIRSLEQSNPTATNTPTETETPKPISNRGRQLITPETITPEQSGSDVAEDPFIREARQRAKADPEAAMQWLQSQSSGTERLRGMLEVVALWAAEDSESALLWLESNAQGLARLETLNNGVELWAERNPTAAADWIDGMANDGSKVAAAKSLAAKWVQQQPEDASSWVSTLPSGPIRNEAAAALAQSWAEQDPKAASIWAFAEAEFNGNTDLLITTVETFTAKEPEEAEAFLREMNEAIDAPKVLTSHVTARAELDPAGTADWLASMTPDDPIYSAEHANQLMQVWAESDSIAASEWLSQQQPGEQRDAAIYGFSESIQRFEPEAAAAWANTIDHPDRRIMRLQDSVITWARTQPVEALNWVKSAELEPAVRTLLADQIGAD